MLFRPMAAAAAARLYDILGAKSRGLMRIMVRRYGCRSVNKLFPTNGDLPKLTPCNIASD